MSQIAVAVTSFIVRGPDLTVFPKLRDVFARGVYGGRLKQKGENVLLLFDLCEDKSVSVSGATGLITLQFQS